MTRTRTELKVWLGGRQVAELTRARVPGHVRCRYTEDALNEWPLNSPVISCSLPLDQRWMDATAFFRGLLPEGEALRIMAQEAGVVTTDTFGLLNRYGRDVAGALVIAPETPDESSFGLQALDAAQMEATIEELGEHPLGALDDSELSLAGIQDKLLLVKTDTGWARPLRGMPSTHILKVNDLAHPGLVEAEGQCLELAKFLGLTTVDNEFVVIGDRDCLIISRYDRQLEDGQVTRVHQEDACQALGIDPMSGPRAKYEDSGGPGFKDIARLLDEYSSDPVAQMDRLVEIMTFTVLIGNADAHGKNLSLLHGESGSISLAPLYDTVPTFLWPKLRRSGAMAIGAQPDLAKVTVAAIGREAKRWNHPDDRAKELAVDLIRRTREALDDGIVPNQSAVHELVKERAAQLLMG